MCGREYGGQTVVVDDLIKNTVYVVVPLDYPKETTNVFSKKNMDNIVESMLSSLESANLDWPLVVGIDHWQRAWWLYFLVFYFTFLSFSIILCAAY